MVGAEVDKSYGDIVRSWVVVGREEGTAVDY